MSLPKQLCGRAQQKLGWGAYTGQANVLCLFFTAECIIDNAMAGRATLLDLPEEVLTSIAARVWDDDRVRSLSALLAPQVHHRC